MRLIKPINFYALHYFSRHSQHGGQIRRNVGFARASSKRVQRDQFGHIVPPQFSPS